MFDIKKFVELTSTSTGKVAPTRINENWFYHQRQSELWTEFLSATELYSDLTLSQRVKVVHLNRHTERPICKCCGQHPVGFVNERVSECCSRECEKLLGIKKPEKAPTGRKYNETGKRAEIIRQRTVERSGFNSESELVSEIKRLAEVEHMPLRMISDRTNLGRDALTNLMKENDISLSDRVITNKVGTRDLYGVDNVMDIPEYKERQRVGVISSFQQHGDEIIDKRNATRTSNLRTEAAQVDSDIISSLTEFLK